MPVGREEDSPAQAALMPVGADHHEDPHSDVFSAAGVARGVNELGLVARRRT